MQKYPLYVGSYLPCHLVRWRCHCIGRNLNFERAVTEWLHTKAARLQYDKTQRLIAVPLAHGDDEGTQ